MWHIILQDAYVQRLEGAVKMLDVRDAYAAGTTIVITYLIDFTWQFAHQIAGENNDGVLKGFLRR